MNKELTVDNKVEELYVSRRMALADLQYTESLLQSSEKADDNSTGSALFYFAIICFFRPFKKSHAIHSGKFIKLDSQNVCPNHSTTFNLLEHERDTRIAHKDITIHNPKLHYWPSHDIFPIALKSSKVLWNDAK